MQRDERASGSLVTRLSKNRVSSSYTRGVRALRTRIPYVNGDLHAHCFRELVVAGCLDCVAQSSNVTIQRLTVLAASDIRQSQDSF